MLIQIKIQLVDMLTVLKVQKEPLKKQYWGNNINGYKYQNIMCSSNT